jgi:hypothetical protein
MHSLWIEIIFGNLLQKTQQNYTFELYLSDITTIIIQSEVVDEYVGIVLSSQLGGAN